MPDFQTETTPTARRKHRCEECWGHIHPGEQYQRIAGCWDGSMGSFKTCMPCVAIRDWAVKQPEWCGDGEHLYYFGQLEEDLAIMAPEIAPGDGRRFKAYRFQEQMNRRRLASKAQQQAA
jgi:hypothetical protein